MKKSNAIRQNIHLQNAVAEKLDEDALYRAFVQKIVKRGNPEAAADLFLALASGSKRKWKRAFSRCVPLAASTAAHLMLWADNEAVRMRAVEYFSEYAGAKPADKHELTGKDGEPLQAAVVVYKIPDNGRDPEMIQTTTAKKAKG